MKTLQDCHLYGILDLGYVAPAQAPRVLEEMLRGGVDLVQLRAKGHSREEIASLAGVLGPVAKVAGVPFLVNDFPDLAAGTGADGAHVGQDDLAVSQARAFFGNRRAIIGKSTHSLAQALAAAAPPPSHPEERPDYIGFGPLFATPTKPDYRPIGLEEIREAHARVDLPIFCIGGIKRENLEAVLDAGARRVVIVSGILRAPDIAAYCREVKARLQSAQGAQDAHLGHF